MSPLQDAIRALDSETPAMWRDMLICIAETATRQGATAEDIAAAVHEQFARITY